MSRRAVVGLIGFALLPTGTQAQESAVKWRMHVLNADSRHEPCGILDVNRDGKLDIMCGSWWYESPDWKPHHVRQIREEGEYHHDFANLPLDVNGDGWIDIVSATWHTKAVLWVENPGRAGGPWKEHLIDTPGNIETLVLADLDGDGDPDALPNCVSQVVWYEFRPAPASQPATGPAAGPLWKAHPLGKEGADHGLGYGDVNGDGRVDIVCPRGWYESPPDPRTDRWPWRPAWDLGRASIPILAFDVDGDRDTDLVWGEGHGYGVYWLEQKKSPGGQVEWLKHEIDKSWAQPHSFVAADIDGDGQTDVVTGKRYRAHNGHDPGEQDPLCIYWYRFDRAAGRWTRHAISEGGRAGFGISSQVADLDGDGDLDVPAPGKSGLYLFENLLKTPAGPS